MVSIMPDLLHAVSKQDIALTEGYSAEKNEYSFSSSDATEGDVFCDVSPILLLSIAYPIQHNILPNKHLNWPVIGKNAPPPKA